MPKDLSIDKPLDKNLKPVKDSDGTLSALEISTDNVRVKSLNVIGNVNVTGEVKSTTTKVISIINTGFFGNSSKMFIPLNGYVFEKTTTSGNNEFVAMIAPFNGKLLKVMARSEAACASTVVGFHKSSSATEVPNSTATSSVTTNMGSDDISYAFDFSNEDSSFLLGEILAISFDPTNSSSDTNVTAVFEYEVI